MKWVFMTYYTFGSDGTIYLGRVSLLAINIGNKHELYNI